MNWLEGLLFGFVSGISEYLPISSPAHQQLMVHLFGADILDPIRYLFIHIGMLVAVCISLKPYLELMMKDRTIHRRHSVHNYPLHQFDRRLIRSAAVPMLIGMFALRYILNLQESLALTALFMLLNGVILFVPARIVQGNKDARHMSILDSLLIGLTGAASVLCGISRIGCTYSVSVARGVSKNHALNWSLALSIFAVASLAFMDIIAIFSAGTADFVQNLFPNILAGITAYLGSMISISIMRFLSTRPNNSGFSYYCWGVALLSFVLYLTIG